MKVCELGLDGHSWFRGKSCDLLSLLSSKYGVEELPSDQTWDFKA